MIMKFLTKNILITVKMFFVVKLLNSCYNYNKKKEVIIMIRVLTGDRPTGN